MFVQHKPQRSTFNKYLKPSDRIFRTSNEHNKLPVTSKDIHLWQGIDQNTNKQRGYDKRASERCSNDGSVYEACSDSRRRCFEYRHKEARVPRRATRGVLVRQRQSDRAIIYRGRKEQNKYGATPRGQTGPSERRVDKSRPEHNVWQLIRDHNQAKMAEPQVRRLIVGVAISWRSNRCRPMTGFSFQDKLTLSMKTNRRNKINMIPVSDWDS